MMRTTLILMLATGAALAGCLEDPEAGVDDQKVLDDVQEEALFETEQLTGSIDIAATTPVRSFNSGGAFATPIALAENQTGIVVEVVWEASGPASEELDVWVRAEGAGSIPPGSAEDWMVEPVAQATGGSPLRLELPADLLGTDAYEVIVRAAGPVGVAHDQPYELFLTTFTGAFDPAYTALDG